MGSIVSVDIFKVKFSKHYYDDPKTNIDEITTIDYIMTSKKMMVKENLFKIERKTKKGNQIYILFRYYPGKNLAKVINAQKKGGR